MSGTQAIHVYAVSLRFCRNYARRLVCEGLDVLLVAIMFSRFLWAF